MIRSLVALVLLFVSSGLAADTAAIRARAQASADALRGADFAAMVDLTHPKVLEMGGGREKMLAELRATADEWKKEGAAIKSVTTGEPSQPVAGKDQQQFSIVPLTLVMEMPHARVTSMGYLLGISDDAGVTWKFIDGSLLEPAVVAEFFPAFPASLKLPVKQEPVVEKK